MGNETGGLSIYGDGVPKSPAPDFLAKEVTVETCLDRMLMYIHVVSEDGRKVSIALTPGQVSTLVRDLPAH